jgi:hypothetical protein
MIKKEAYEKIIFINGEITDHALRAYFFQKRFELDRQGIELVMHYGTSTVTILENGKEKCNLPVGKKGFFQEENLAGTLGLDSHCPVSYVIIDHLIGDYQSKLGGEG